MFGIMKKDENKKSEQEVAPAAPAAPADERRPLKEALEEAYCLGAGISGEELAKAKAKLEEIAEAARGDEFNPEMLQLVLRILNYDRTIEEARRKGYEQGKAENAVDAFRNKRSAAEKAASLPQYGGTKGIGAGRLSDSIFDVARGAE